MHRIPALRLVIMGLVISIMASSWVWAHGPAGVITTVGAVIALSLPAVEDITVASWAIMEMAAPMAPPCITTNLTPPQRITANLTPPRITPNPTLLLTLLLMPPRRMVGKLTMEVGNLTVVAESTTSQ